MGKTRSKGAFCEGPSCTVAICEQCKCSDVLFKQKSNRNEIPINEDKF